MRSNMALAVQGEAETRENPSVTDIGDRPIVALPPVELERGAVLAGRYQIETVIGAGGSGVVLRAFDRITQTPVALKILKAELAAEPRWAERFSRELRLGRQIQHPNVCRVFDIGEADGHRFMSMELATGGTLGDVRGEKPLRPFAERVADARALVSGVAAIHAAGIIHRDVKPENLLRMEDGRVVVSDFGLATNPDQVPTVTVMVGTPSYMAPEMVMGDPASKSSDVWALGVTMHEILFGKRPEWDMTLGERAFRDPCGATATRLERALASLCGACSSENTARRPVDAGEVDRLFSAAESGRARGTNVVSRSSRQRWGWAAVATLAFGGFFALKGNFWTTALATSVRADGHQSVVEPEGEPVDWTRSSQVIAELPGRVHCFSLLPDKKTVRIVWGDPRTAEDVALDSRKRSPAQLLRSTYQQGCPEFSPRGDGLLFSLSDAAGGAQIMHSNAPDGSDARPVTRGSDPRWLPNGKEFLFSLDDTHAAVFALPTMTFKVVVGASGEVSGLMGEAVSPRGDAFALMYFDSRADRIVAVHSLPGLLLARKFRLPSATRHMDFVDDSDHLAFSIEDAPSTSRWAQLDLRSGDARNIGRIPGSDVRRVARTDSGQVVLSRRMAKDAWLDDGSGRRALTSDGESYTGAVSSKGDLLLGKRTDDGRFVVVAYRADGTHVGQSPGPKDVMPAFAPDGSTWAYVSYETKSLVVCRASWKDCRPIHVNNALPSWPVFSPDGASISYISQLNNPRLYVMPVRGGRAIDLGPVRDDCPPVWKQPRSLWTYQGTETERYWVEIDPVTAVNTGRQVPARMAAPGQCPSEEEEAGSPFSQRLRILTQESSTIRYIAD